MMRLADTNAVGYQMEALINFYGDQCCLMRSFQNYDQNSSINLLNLQSDSFLWLSMIYHHVRNRIGKTFFQPIYVLILFLFNTHLYSKYLQRTHVIGVDFKYKFEKLIKMNILAYSGGARNLVALHGL